MERYSIKPYGNHRYEVQDLQELDGHKIVKGIYDSYEEAETAVGLLNMQVMVSMPDYE